MAEPNVSSRLRQTLFDLSRRLQSSPDENVVDFTIFRLEQVCGHLARMGNRFNPTLHAILEVISLLRNLNLQNRSLPRVLQQTRSSSVGRPKFVITREQLVYMLDYDISVPAIARVLGVSQSTIKRRLTEYGISIRSDQDATLTDMALDELVRDVQEQFPNAGYRRIYSVLRSRSIRVTQARLEIHCTGLILKVWR